MQPKIGMLHIILDIFSEVHGIAQKKGVLTTYCEHPWFALCYRFIRRETAP